MKELHFQWDVVKANENLKKHGVSFEEAKSVFFNEHAIEFYDDEHSEREDRFFLLGGKQEFKSSIDMSLFQGVGIDHKNNFGKKGDKERIKTLYRWTMKAEYDLSKMKSRPNPYAKRLKKQVTLRIGVDIIEYFKGLSSRTGIPYQSLINLYLRDCASSHRELKLNWENIYITNKSTECAATAHR